MAACTFSDTGIVLVSANKGWMLQRSDYVITYVNHPWGGAARFAAEIKSKNSSYQYLINLIDHPKESFGLY